MTKPLSSNIRRNEQGLAALVVTAMLMTVVSLIVLGFAQVTRREQTQTLENQLATQAFYAAESGVNLAQSRLGLVTGSKTTCGPDANFSNADYNISADGSVRITCLLLNKNVKTLEFQNVGSSPRVSLIKSLSGAPFTNIYVAWHTQNAGAITGCPAPDATAGRLPVGSGADLWNCNQPLLRVDLVPLADTNNLVPATLALNQLSTFLYPVNGGTKPSVFNYSDSSGASIGRISPVSCTTDTSTHPRYCVARIVVNVAPSAAYAVRLVGLYGEAGVSIYGSTASETNATLTDGQVEIDSTARAVDVLKRVQTRVGLLSTNGEGADGPLTTTGLGICKQYFVTPTGVDIPGGTDAFCGIN